VSVDTLSTVLCGCSAGIGRTGVLIAMETAMCLIEANEPVSLPDIVCQMRDQRAMLIQTSVTQLHTVFTDANVFACCV